VLVAPVVAGPFQYELFQDAHEGWYLRSKDNRPVEVSPPSAGPDLPVPPAAVAALPRVVAAASPEVSLNNALAAMAQNLGLQALATADTRHGRTRGGGTHHWARAFGADGRVRGGGLQARGADFDYGGGGVQAGVDTPLWRGDAIEDRIGGYASAGGQQASVMHFDGSAAGRNTLRARGVGSYWTRTSNEGWYLDAVGQYLRYAQVRTRSVQGIAGQTTGWGAATSLEAGRSIPLDARTRVEPQAQWIVQRAHLDGLRDSHGNAVRLGGSTSVLGRVGARVVRDWGEANPGDPAGSAWLRVNAWHEFAGRSAARYDTANGALAYRRDMGGTWGELEIGFRASLSSGTSFHASVGIHHGLGGTRREGTSASGGAATGLGLSMQLTRNARLSSGLAYDSGAGTDGGLNAKLALDLKW
jgi:outer membrane autotransporter protein